MIKVGEGMFRYVFNETIKRTWRNKKLRLLLVLTVLLILVYCTLILPRTSTDEIMDVEGTEALVENHYGTKENQLQTGMVQFTQFTGQDTYATAKKDFEELTQLHYAMQDGDLERIMQFYALGIKGPSANLSEVPSLFPLRETNEFALGTYYNMAHGVEHLNTDVMTTHMLEDKTAIQQLHRFVERYLPIVFLLITVFIASEVLVSDRKHRTIKAGKPIDWRMYILYQSIAVFVISGLYMLGTMIFYTLVNGLLFGFGSLGTEITKYRLLQTEDSRINVFRGDTSFFEVQNAWAYVGLSIIFILVMMFVIIRISMLFSLIFRQDMIVLVLGVLLVTITSIYLADGSEPIFGIDPWYLPQNYIEIGRVLMGEQNYIAFTDQFTFTNGLITMGMTLLVVEVLLLIASFIMNRQRFERQVR